MCYSFINAVTWAQVQLGKKSHASSVKPPTQVSSVKPVPSPDAIPLRSEEPFDLYSPVCNSFVLKTSCHCWSVKALKGKGESVIWFLKDLGR